MTFTTKLAYEVRIFSFKKSIHTFCSSMQCMGVIIRTFLTEGEEKDKVVKEARENLKSLEGALEGKKFFGGETIGYLEIAAGWIRPWTQIVEEIAGVKVMDAETMPLLNTWFDNFLQVPAVKECIPPRDKLREHLKGLYVLWRGSST